ncbi:chitinase [Kitasatospora sp. NBC_01287]|uniref:chitinase n=1 Tax=Kitasatospora sp. NBC_01287 TaxID=2903573 RepID=UPI0022516CA9|nr:chitinase [Kitasatospora sp. NBC_01287]MCX4744959.1 chitinase [Kitasatospora sp. NBC_01287]
MRHPPRLALTLVPLALSTGLLLGTPSPAQATALPGPGFPARYTAPYLETWRAGSSLTAARRATGLQYFTLAFVISDGTCNGAFDGTVPVTDQEWQTALSQLRTSGGDAIASFGGGAGTELALTCESVGALKAAYRRVIDALDLTVIDFDIEGTGLGETAAIDRRNQALAELCREYAAGGRTLSVHYTLPANPDGLSAESLRLLRNARERGLDVSLVNIMTMDYGPDLNMGRIATTAAEGLHDQMARIWPEKSAAELWAMQGNTPMIGVNDATNEVFSVEDARTLAKFADEKGIQLLSFWSVGRDQSCLTEGVLAGTCSGTAQQPGQFSQLLDRPHPRRPHPAPDWRPPRCLDPLSSLLGDACAGGRTEAVASRGGTGRSGVGLGGAGLAGGGVGGANGGGAGLGGGGGGAGGRPGVLGALGVLGTRGAPGSASGRYSRVGWGGRCGSGRPQPAPWCGAPVGQAAPPRPSGAAAALGPVRAVAPTGALGPVGPVGPGR